MRRMETILLPDQIIRKMDKEKGIQLKNEIFELSKN